MWQLNSEWYDLVLRGLIIYIFIFLISRLKGKKQLSKLSPFDFNLILVISLCLYNSILGTDKSIPAAVIIVGVLSLLHYLMGQLTYRFSWFEKLILGQPEVVILNGKIHKKVLLKEKISETELFEALREHEVMKTEEVKCAILETDGKISVIKYGHTH